MPLTHRSADSLASAWKEFAASASSSDSHLWLTHRLHRDLLLEHAAKEGAPGWLNPPFAFFSELPARFGIRTRPISLLDRRSLINGLALEHAKTNGISLPAAGANITRASVIDSFFSEILPEGITPDELERQLKHAAEDDFAVRRNRWIISVYTAYLAQLSKRGQYDPRSIHALIADRIDAGELPKAINGAKELHIYGLYSDRARRRLMQALEHQNDVNVVVHQLDPDASTSHVTVQPAPDAWREAEWVAAEVKKLIVNEGIEPHDIAVVARTGLEDTRRTLQVMRAAGLPCTARVRSALTEIGAVKALLVLFRAAAEDWTYPNLRRVLTNPYFKTGVDVRTIDRIAREARPHSLAAWLDELQRVIERAELEALTETDADRKAAQELRIERYRDAIPQLQAITPTLQRLDEARSLPAWITFTRELLENGWFDFRRRICRPPEARYDIMRFDQRAVRQLENVLRQWGEVAAAEKAMQPDQWYALFRTLLAGQELALTTPGQKGVQILEAHDAAMVPFRATFLLHANDGVFPRLPGAGGLFAEEEKEALRAAGLPIETYDTAIQRERALWNAVTAGERVVVSYRTTDPKGTPLLPSLLVPQHDGEAELPRSVDLVSEPLNAQQESYDVACALGEAIRDDVVPARILAPHPSLMRHAILQAHAEQKRGAPEREVVVEPLNPWNGVMRDPLVLQHLNTRFGPDHMWSASQLELYGKCPFFYLLQRVLRLEETEEADEETNALTSGGVAHDILEHFYGEIKDRLPIDMPTATAIFAAGARAEFDEREASGEWLGLPALWQQRKHWLCETLAAFIEWDIAKNLKGGEKPYACEYVLGGASEVAELVGTDIYGNAMRMKLRGRIDRVDQVRSGGLRVIDYKTNSTPSGKTGFVDGSVVQGVIYIEALKQEGLPAESSVYRSLKGLRNAAEIRITNPEYDVALRVAFSIPARARAGLFEVNLAASQDWAPWNPDASITRSRAQLGKGESRFK